MKQAVPLTLLLNPDHHHALCIWIKLHQLYKKPIFYNWDYKSLSAKSGISHTCLRKHIPNMLKMGWCAVRDGHLCFKGINQFKTKVISIPVHASKKKQMLELRYAIIRKNLDNQERQQLRKAAIVHKSKSANLRLTPKELKQLRNGTITEKSVQPPNLSNKKFGKLVNRSKSTGQRLQKLLRKELFIKVKNRFRIVKRKCNAYEFKELFMLNTDCWYKYSRYKFNSKTGDVLEQLTNSIKALKGKDRSAKVGSHVV